MTAKQRVMSLAQELGATIDDGSAGNEWFFNIDAPRGKRWVEGSVHSIVTSQYRGTNTHPMWQDALERMRYGLEDCPDAGDGCDYCDEEEG